MALIGRVFFKFISEKIQYKALRGGKFNAQFISSQVIFLCNRLRRKFFFPQSIAI